MEFELVKQTTTNFYVDELSRQSSGPSVAGRGAAMAAASNNVQYHWCKAYALPVQPLCCREGTRFQTEQRKGKRKGGDPSPTWCSYHKTNSHSDSACYKQKEPKQLSAYFVSLTTADRARVADIGSAHIPQMP